MARLISSIKILLVFSIFGLGQLSYAKKQKPMNLEDATSFIQKNSQGKVLSAKTLHENGVNTHRIKVITPSGRVKVYKLPSNSSVKKRDNRSQSNNRNQTRNKKPRPNQNRARQDNRNTNNTSMRNTPNTTSRPKGEIRRK